MNLRLESPPTKRHLVIIGLIIFGGLIWLALIDFVSGPSVEGKEGTELGISVTPENFDMEETVADLSQIKPDIALASIPSQTPSPPTATLPPPTPASIIHTVQEGEVLFDIAYGYGTTVQKIMAANGLEDPTLLQIGTELLIPVTPTPTPRFSPTPTLSPTPTPEPTTYLVQPGDVLLSIADEYDTTVEAIMIANGITDPHALQMGQEIIIPEGQGTMLGVPTKSHVIMEGETLISIADQYGSTVEDILASNPELEPTLLGIGQIIIVPLTRPENNLVSNPGIPRVTAPAPPSPEMMALEQKLIQSVNRHRQAQGLTPYTIDERLTRAARMHAQDMTIRGYFSHISPEGAAVRDRLEENGVEAEWSAENIQRNVQPVENTVQYAMNWFMGSRVHRSNILNSGYTRMGVSVIEDPSGWHTFVLVFASS